MRKDVLDELGLTEEDFNAEIKAMRAEKRK